MGWMGSKSELHNTLAVFKCDKDAEGKFKVAGSITSFMGMGDEFVVGDDAVAFIEGKPVKLASLLSQTSYGLKVTVI